MRSRIKPNKAEACAVRCVGVLGNAPAVWITVTPPGYLIRDAAQKQVRNLRLRDSSSTDAVKVCVYGLMSRM